MTYKMDVSGETQGTKESMKESTAEVSHSKVDDNSNDIRRFARERNLLLLSALYKLYGEEWISPPDWSKVAEEIKKADIPNFGENFTAESCELQYKSLLETGYQVGIAKIATVIKAPKRLTEAQKRLWILASTSNDIVDTSKILDAQMRVMYKKQLDEIEKLGQENSNVPVQELTKELENAEEIDPSDELELDIGEYDDPDTQELAVELPQMETTEMITGMKDVLLLAKYCGDAADNATKKLPSLIPKKETPVVTPASSPTKGEKNVDFTKSNISTNEVSQELTNLVQSAISNAAEDETSKITSPTTSTAPTLSKLLELPITTPGMPLPEIPTLKQSETSPEKQSTRNAARGNSKEKTIPEPVKDESASKIESSPKGNGEQPTPPQTSSPVKSSTILDSNGQDSVSAVASPEKSPLKSDGNKEKMTVEDSTSNTNKTATDNVVETDTETKVTNNDASKNSSANTDNDVTIIDDSSEATTSSESSEVNESTNAATSHESPVKGKQVLKKGTSAARPISTRTSSRLVSPEPNEQPSTEEEKGSKKARLPSTSDSHTPTLRSRRGATPTKAGPVESESAKTASSASASKLDFTEENDNDAFETPRSTPESPEMKLDLETIHDTKPPKPVKVYSAKPPSPLTHVDATLFDQFIDDEDDPELTMIDSNVHKTKSEKDKSATKTYTNTKRGRTVSSENASDVGISEENAQNKRVVRKVLNDDGEDGDGIGNNDEGASKRLTRSSLKMHDAANEESIDTPQTESEKAASEKAPSESSMSGKDKKPRQTKSMIRLRTLQEESKRVYGSETEEIVEGKRRTRAQARTSGPQPEKRSKPPSVGESEGLSESEPTSTRATRSRSSTTATNMPVLEPTSTQQPPVNNDDEEYKIFRKNVLALLDKVAGNEIVTLILKHCQEDSHKILKRNVDIGSIKSKVENGKARTIAAVHHDLTTLATNAIMANPNSAQVKENATSFYKLLKTFIEDFKNQPGTSSLKNDKDSDVESLDETRSETSSKQIGGGGKRKRKRSVSETSEDVPPENKRRVTRTSTSNAFQMSPTKPKMKPKHPISPDIVSANRVRH